ncbi:MAG: hypothetical protein JW932_20955 [Deltaproteobacteria bacterium]|nr:hypothetical protein [Deltaproteobacteria bacterium]
MISINATLILQIIHILILVFILNRLMFRPIIRTTYERRKYIEDAKKQAMNMEEEARELMNKCIAIEKDARREAGHESARIKREALAVAEQIFDEARNKVSTIRDEINKEIDEQLEKAKQFLQSEAVSLADEITEKVISRRIAH